MFFSNNKFAVKLSCQQQADAFTANDKYNGNGSLRYKIGLITTDDVVLSGGYSAANSKFYLYTHQSFWPMSPKSFNETYVEESIMVQQDELIIIIVLIIVMVSNLLLT